MPAFPPAPQVIKCSLIHNYGANIPAWTHIYLRYTGSAPAAADMQTIASSVNGNWQTNLVGLCHPNVTLQNVICTDLSSATTPQGTSNTVRTGTRTGGPLTANDCAIENLLIGRRYRGGKPKRYWPFGTDTDVLNPQQWVAASQSAFLTGLINYASALNAITWTGGNITAQANVSYFQGFTVVTNPITHRARNVPTLRVAPVIDSITGRTVNARIGTQRRRQHFSA